ncbi:MAG: gamma carbonic anhydrase family protein [Bacteroidetes bacterium]|nr:gamma carbonic anhydrase family protein [Bacteroidota bacterium]MCW5897373.1 gamma carbonic anhydrase family protein [Bacteroidota bacterium]
MTIISYRGISPIIDQTAFVAEGTRLIGDVTLSKDSSIWFNSVLRGDINRVEIGERTNIQDCSVLHVTEEYPVIVGNDVTVGHRAIIHGCTVGDCCLIGMGAVILDNANVGSHSLVAAGAVVLQNFVVPEGVLVAGVPAKVIRPLTEEEKRQIRESALRYVEYARGYRS